MIDLAVLCATMDEDNSGSLSLVEMHLGKEGVRPRFISSLMINLFFEVWRKFGGIPSQVKCKAQAMSV